LEDLLLVTEARQKALHYRPSSATSIPTMPTTVLTEVAPLAFPIRCLGSSPCRRVTRLLGSPERHASAGSSASTPQRYGPRETMAGQARARSAQRLPGRTAASSNPVPASGLPGRAASSH